MLDCSKAAGPSEHGEHHGSQKAGLLTQTSGSDANEPNAHLDSLKAEVLQRRPPAAVQWHTQPQHRQHVARLVSQLLGKGARLRRRVTVDKTTLLAVTAQVKGLIELVTQGLGSAQLLDSVAPKEPVVNKRTSRKAPGKAQTPPSKTTSPSQPQQAPGSKDSPVPSPGECRATNPREDPSVLLVVALHKLPDTGRATKVPEDHHQVREPHGVEELSEVLLQVKARATERLKQAEEGVLEAPVDATKNSPGSPALNPRGQLLHQNPSTDSPSYREDGQGTVALTRLLDEDHASLPPSLWHSAGHKHALPKPRKGAPKGSRKQHPRGAGPVVRTLRFVKHALSTPQQVLALELEAKAQGRETRPRRQHTSKVARSRAGAPALQPLLSWPVGTVTKP